MSGGKKRKGKGGQGSFKWGLLMGLAALSLAYWPINPHLKDPHSFIHFIHSLFPFFKGAMGYYLHHHYSLRFAYRLNSERGINNGGGNNKAHAPAHL